MIGEILAYLALAFGLLFFTYAVRYYAALVSVARVLLKSSSGSGNGQNSNENVRYANGGGLSLRISKNGNGAAYSKHANGSGVIGPSAPMVSIHIPLYNEERVVDRLMEALSSLDYPNYEVVVVDDSTDSTTEKLLKWKNNPRFKIIHRQSRAGFKGGALNEALRNMSPEAKYVAVFDADFIPPKDILQTLLGQFVNGNGNGLESWKRENTVVAVQGYQWHVLNASENWVTKAVTAEYAGNYLVERLFLEQLPGVKMIAGSVFMIKADILKRYGWTECLTEDWDLTLRLYRDGYKIVYSPVAAAPAECPSRVVSLMRQRARWAEGHTFAVKKYFFDIIRSRFLGFREKLEFLYLTPYYLNSLFLLVGTAAWLSAELLGARIPFWTQVFGWSLMFTNLLAIPLVNITGLFLEYRASRHWPGALFFIPLMHALAIPQTIAAVKGLVEKRESAWFRTLKTGHVTESFLFLRLRRLVRRNRERSLPGKRFWSFLLMLPLALTIVRLGQVDVLPTSMAYLILFATAASTIMYFGRKAINIKPTVFKTAALAATTLFIITLALTTPAQAPIPTQTLYFYTGAGTSLSSAANLSPTAPPSGTQIISNSWHYWRSTNTYNFAPSDSGTWQLHVEGYGHNGFICSPPDWDCVERPTTLIVEIYVSSSPSLLGTFVGSTTISVAGQFSTTTAVSVSFTSSCSNCYIHVIMRRGTTGGSLEIKTGGMSPNSWLLIPENGLILAAVMPALLAYLHMVRRRARSPAHDSTAKPARRLPCWSCSR
ncbi:MAG: glycosyltransferase family 2 protein [Candidatus Caldarchaeum sp.]|nr:glycosyltransferase family 2 protein [Candidatus Caldarchaeum sp.]